MGVQVPPWWLTVERSQRVLGWIVGIPFWAGVIFGVIVTLILTAIF